MNNRTTILIVEDDLCTRNAIMDVLTLHGFSVQPAGDGFEALEAMRKQPPDLILSDIIMPSMNGYQFYHRVRGNAEWLQIPFIFLTVKDSVEDVRLGRELGADDYIVKPFEVEDLLAAVVGKLERFDQLTQVFKDTGQLVGDRSDIAAVRDALSSLSDREREVLMLICGGLSNLDIADRLTIAVSTVKSHVASILAKLGVGSRMEAASIVLQAGLDLLDDVPD